MNPVDEPLVTTAAVRSVASWGISGSTFGLPTTPLDRRAWNGLERLIGLQRMWGILAAAMAAGDWPATEAQRDLTTRNETDAAAQMLVLDRTVLDLVNALDRTGIDHRLLKGPAHAHRLWAKGWLRYYSDIDLLARSEQFDRAVALIERDFGGERHNPDPLPGLTARVGKSAAFTLPSGVEIDLHRTLTEGPFGASIALDDLWETGSVIRIGTRDIDVLSAPAMVLHSSMHAVLAGDVRRLVPYRDIAESLRLVGQTIDLEALLDMAERWRCSLVLAQAVARATDLFSLEETGPLGQWAASYRPGGRERRWLAYQGHGFPAARFLETSAMAVALPTWSDRLLYTRGVVWHEGRDPLSARAGRVLRALRLT